MIEFTVRIRVELLALVLAFGGVVGMLYALALSTERGREICQRRTHWTVVGGHLLMALTMCFVSAPMAGLWILWSVAHGLPLVARSELRTWRCENCMAAAVGAAVRAARRGGRNEGEKGEPDPGGGDGYGGAGAGDVGIEGPGSAGDSQSTTWSVGCGG